MFAFGGYSVRYSYHKDRTLSELKLESLERKKLLSGRGLRLCGGWSRYKGEEIGRLVVVGTVVVEATGVGGVVCRTGWLKRFINCVGWFLA